jgi:hypothetical protein
MAQANVILNNLCGLQHSNFVHLLLTLSVYNQSESRAQEKHYNTKSKVNSNFLQLL